MIVRELIEQLLKQPQDAVVQKSYNDGCPECNPEGFSYYRDVDEVRFMEEGEYPQHDEKNIVVL